MKVYIAFFCDWEIHDVYGVYASLELAQQYHEGPWEEVPSADADRVWRHPHDDYAQIQIEEYEVEYFSPNGAELS